MLCKNFILFVKHDAKDILNIYLTIRFTLTILHVDDTKELHFV
jgi:hypothetical protein